jgi:serine/threonine protein kinase
VRAVARQLLQALAHCHARGVLHRDVAPKNVLLTRGGDVKLADFGLARVDGAAPATSLSEYVVTRWYRAPELLLGAERYGGGVDVWSAGVLLLEALLGEVPWAGRCGFDQLRRLFAAKGTPDEASWPGVRAAPYYDESWPRWPRRPVAAGVNRALAAAGRPPLDPDCADLLERMLEYAPERRVSAADALQHRFFRAAASGLHPRDPAWAPLSALLQPGAAVLPLARASVR